MYTLLAQDYFQPVKMVGKFIDYCLNFVKIVFYKEGCDILQ